MKENGCFFKIKCKYLCITFKSCIDHRLPEASELDVKVVQGDEELNSFMRIFVYCCDFSYFQCTYTFREYPKISEHLQSFPEKSRKLSEVLGKDATALRDISICPKISEDFGVHS